MKRKPLLIMLTVLLLMTLVFGVAAVNAAEKDSAKLTFAGVTMKAQGDSVQGFLDIKVSNVENQGVGFTLQYDTDWVELSCAADNTVPAGGEDPDVESMIAWNEKDFGVGTFFIDGAIDRSDKIASAEMDIFVSPLAAVGGYIEERNVAGAFADTTKVVNAAGKTLTLGSISFNIKKPAEFAKLGREELSNIFRVGTYDDGALMFAISYIDTTCDPPVVFYDQESHLSYEFALENAISAVRVNNDNPTTNAAYVYESSAAPSTYQDLLAWVNDNMQNVTVCYADGTEIADTVVWSKEADGFKLYKDGAEIALADYDCKGGNYVIEQRYNEDISVRATVNVKPVTVLGYTCDNDYLHYASVGDLPDSTDYHEVLTLPESAQAVYDAFVSGKTDVGNVVYVESDVADDGYVAWSCTACPTGADKSDLLSIKNDAVEGQYEYSAAVVAGLPIWATVPSDLRVKVTRVLGAITPEPTFDWEVTPDGWLIISNIKVSGYTDITKVDFQVRLPNGLVLDAAQFTNTNGGGYYKVETSGDAAKISLKAEDISVSQQAALQQAINLGKKLGKFALAAQANDPALPRSDWKEFATEPRRNVYLGAKADGTGNYSFDYSAVPNIFSIEEDATNLRVPPLTVVLPQGDAVKLTYSGLTGFEPGRLSTITVKNWTSDGTELAVGNVVTFTGELAEAYYADHGTVYNDNNISVSLTLTVTGEKPEEKIEPIENVVFSKMQVGYTITENKQVMIKNIGTVDISGLTVTMKPEAGSENAFTMTVVPPYVLTVGDSISCKFDRNMGLPKGTYRAEVTIGSNRTAELAKFNVSVEIIEGEVYKVNVVVKDGQSSWGDAKAIYGDYYEIGEEVYLQAKVANEDYTFVGWKKTAGPEVTFESVLFASTPQKDAEAYFALPSDIASFTPAEVTIEAEFAAKETAALRLQELHLYNPDDTKSENDLLHKDDKGNFTKLAFDPLTLNYYAIVPSSAETNRAEFVFEQPAEGNVAISATLTAGGKVVDLTDEIVQDTTNTNLYYIDYADLPLAVAPTVNNLTIGLTIGENVRNYSVDIYRKLAAEDMAEFGYGNSPFGLIMQDSSVNHDEKKADFRLTNSFTDYVPNGGKKNVVYHPDAWGNAAAAAALGMGDDPDIGNYDRHDYALFVYVGDEFSDPGIGKVKNSLGEVVEASKVTRTVYGLNALADYDPSQKPIDDFQQGTPYDLSVDSGKATLDRRVRPGVYALTYEYKDYNGDVLKLTRPLIVLYKLGDVNMNGSVNSDDADMIANRYNARLPYGELSGYESNCRLYQYRICDVNCDRNINVGDRNLIKNSGALSELYK